MEADQVCHKPELMIESHKNTPEMLGMKPNDAGAEIYQVAVQIADSLLDAPVLCEELLIVAVSLNRAQDLVHDHCQRLESLEVIVGDLRYKKDH